MKLAIHIPRRFWGDNSFGEGDAPEGQFIDLSAGLDHTCAIDLEGAIQCWGYNEHGQSDPPEGTFEKISAGYFHSCAIDSNGRVECWGIADGSQYDYDQTTRHP